MTEPIVFVPLGIGAILLVWVIVNYNRFARLRQYVKESWSDIDVELKRRYELIPNLVETVKGYAKHERETLERVVALRNTAVASRGSAAAQATDESALMLGVKQLFAVAEGYPELKSDTQFLALQKELGITEDRIAAARRFFNANVRELKTLREMFPTSILAAMFGIQDPSYFELESAAERVVPRVALE